MVKLPAGGGWRMGMCTCEYRIGFSRPLSFWLLLLPPAPVDVCKRRICRVHAEAERRASVYFTYSTYNQEWLDPGVTESIIEPLVH
eukprot:scaffold328_cov95-Skeletonema_dohrnii-CCMP3373.AAC.8